MKKTKNKMSVAVTVSYSALLTAACVIIAFMARSIFGTGYLRFTVESLPIFIGAFLFGPVAGGAIALAADLLACLLSGMSPLPLVSVGAFLIGGVSGVMYNYVLGRVKGNIRIVVSVFSGHIVGSMVVKSMALYVFYGAAVFLRIPVYLGIAVLESVLLVLVMKNKVLRRQLESVKENK